jgi:hypothetical protein
MALEGRLSLTEVAIQHGEFTSVLDDSPTLKEPQHPHPDDLQQVLGDALRPGMMNWMGRGSIRGATKWPDHASDFKPPSSRGNVAEFGAMDFRTIRLRIPPHSMMMAGRLTQNRTSSQRCPF